MASLTMNDVLGEIRRAKGKDAAIAISASIDANNARKKVNQLEDELDTQKKELNKKWSIAVGQVLVTAPVAAAAGYLVGDFLHDKVVERLGKDNMATPFVLPAVGIAVAYYGYSGKGLQLDERAAMVGGGVGVAAGSFKRSYYDFWAGS